jgi:serine protease DegQ
VLAIGNPFGVGQTVTFIQTDAAINPGNSGGALVDTSGQLIGINTAIYSRAPGGASLGIGFAIPASTAKQVLEQIMQSGQVTRGWIGVGVQDMTRELSTSFKLPEIRGALITEVFRGTPADKAGIKLGDILIAVEGTPVTDSSSMLNLVAALNPGKQATFKVVRSQQETDVKVIVGRRPLQQRQGQ